MKIARRQILQLTAATAALPAASRIAWTQSYPSRPVRWIAPGPAGGGTDTFARVMAQWLSERFSQPFVMENRPGAGGNIGTEAVVRAPADGYTLLLVAVANAINVTLYDKLNFDFIHDIAPVAGLVRLPIAVVVHPSFPAKTIPELVAYAKDNPSKVNMASPGNGTSGHVAGELFKMMTDIDMVHVPYRGAPQAVTDLMGGQVQVMFATTVSSMEYIRDGKLRALAVTTATRLESLPEVPTIAEFIPGYEASAWYGVGAPKNTPAQIIERLNKEINAGLADPKMKVRLADLGGTPLALSPSDFAKLIAEETEKWAKVVRFAGARPD
jgi:tripartite-type tricarboxylate transporter receptor subunit TctC